MKSFFFASALFIILVISIIANAIYINNNCEELLDLSSALKDGAHHDFHSNLQRFEEAWLHFRKTARISCSNSELNNIDIIIDEMYAAHNSNAHETCVILQARLNTLIRGISQLEKISFN